MRHVPATGSVPIAETLGERPEVAVDRRNGRRVVEQLHRFADGSYHVEADDVYEAALDTITLALGCARASVLLRDDAGTMRFAAWRGLSDAYLRTVEGHAFWTRDAEDPQPVFIQDIEAAHLPESLREAARTEQIVALACAPLVANGALVGKLVAYFETCHELDPAEVALAVAIARQLGFSLERRRVEEALRASQRQLVAELAAAEQLQKTSTQLIEASNVEALYEKILDAATIIMRSDFASMQMLCPERGELKLLAYRGFTPSAAAFWEWVRPGSGSTCGIALATGRRVIVPDVELSDFIAGSEDLETFRQTGIRAVQSTPLVSRAGRLLGMISTHWRNPHAPSERDLRLFDVLARQAADLIERKQAELTDQHLAAIVDSSHDAILSTDLDGLITTWNRGAERLLGYGSDEMIGRPITTLIPPDRHGEDARVLEHIRRGERVDPFETVRKHRDGSTVDVSVSVSPLKDAAGEVIGASRITRDISARKKADLALAERTIQLALAGKSARVGNFAYDVDTERMQICAGYAAIHGFPDGTTEVARSEWQRGVHPVDSARWEALRSRAFRERWAEYGGEYRVVRPGGEIRWIEARVFVSYTADGRPQRAVGVDIDVTGRKRGQEQRRILNAELDHRVKNVLATVSAIAAHTRRTSRSMDDFVVALDSRIQSMASTHELLSRSRWEGAALRELVRRELAPYASNNNTCIEGPEVALRAEAAQTTASVLHELATNAAKYGALSAREGRVVVRWRFASNRQQPGPLVIEWLETGGPAVEAPSSSGFGRSVITELVPYELGGEAQLAFSPDGVRCRLDIPGKWLAPLRANRAEPEARRAE